MPVVVWQVDLSQELTARLPASATLHIIGSAATPALLDAWSDLDVRLSLAEPVDAVDLLGGRKVWALDDATTSEAQVLRLVLMDGCRLDMVIAGSGRVNPPPMERDNEVRFLAALAAVKLGRGDQLIGLHLVLELLRSCLVQAMLLRDQDTGTNLHRFGTARDAMAAEVARLIGLPLTLTPRPNVVERAVSLYGQWRGELERDYRPDWSGLSAVLARGLAEAA
jgi:hypothetical protein